MKLHVHHSDHHNLGKTICREKGATSMMQKPNSFIHSTSRGYIHVPKRIIYKHNYSYIVYNYLSFNFIQ